jgi:hypothetical protein
MDVQPPLITDPKPSVVMDPCQRPFDRSAGLTQTALIVDPLLQSRREPSGQAVASRRGHKPSVSRR